MIATPTTISPESQLEAYFETDPKYHPDPVPTPIDAGVVNRFVLARLGSDLSPAAARKLSRLAVFYDLRETTAAFLTLLRSLERSDDDFACSLRVILTIAWIGDDKQWQTADDYFHGLISRGLDPLALRPLLLAANDALGPKEGTAPLRARLGQEVARLDAALKNARQGDSPSVRGMELRLNAIREFATLDCDRLDQLFDIRRGIDALPTTERRIGRLAALYTGDDPESVPETSRWAALSLLRIQSREPGLLPTLRATFEALSKKHQRVDPDPQAESVAVRARALRAMDYFGAPPPADVQQWLTRVDDAGVDPLVLRPRWEYPSRPPTTGPASRP